MISNCAGLLRKEILEYLIKTIVQATYVHDREFAPAIELLDPYIYIAVDIVGQ